MSYNKTYIMKYNIVKTEATFGNREGKIIATANSLEEAELLKQKLENDDPNKWNIYELKMI